MLILSAAEALGLKGTVTDRNLTRDQSVWIRSVTERLQRFLNRSPPVRFLLFQSFCTHKPTIAVQTCTRCQQHNQSLAARAHSLWQTSFAVKPSHVCADRPLFFLVNLSVFLEPELRDINVPLFSVQSILTIITLHFHLFAFMNCFYCCSWSLVVFFVCFVLL